MKPGCCTVSSGLSVRHSCICCIFKNIYGFGRRFPLPYSRHHLGSSTVWSLFYRALIQFRTPPSSFKYFPKAPPTNIITLWVRISTYDVWGDKAMISPTNLLQNPTPTAIYAIQLFVYHNHHCWIIRLYSRRNREGKKFCYATLHAKYFAMHYIFN